MKSKTKTILGIVIILPIAVYIIALALRPKQVDPFSGVPKDLETVPSQSGMPYELSSVDRANTEYRVSHGGSRKDGRRGPPWDYYFIWVKKYDYSETFGEGWLPFFSRWFEADEVPENIWEEKIEDLISYEKSTRVVTFEIGSSNIVCTLPPPIEK